jgi:hypothetical protein
VRVYSITSNLYAYVTEQVYKIPDNLMCNLQFHISYTHILTRQNYVHIQGVSRLEDITAAGDFLGLSDQKIHINMCPVLDGYGVMANF